MAGIDANARTERPIDAFVPMQDRHAGSAVDAGPTRGCKRGNAIVHHLAEEVSRIDPGASQRQARARRLTHAGVAFRQIEIGRVVVRLWAFRPSFWFG